MSDGESFRPLTRREADELRGYAYPGAVVRAISLLIGHWTGADAYRRNARADLARGQARVRRIEVVEAVLFEEREDEGPTIFVLTADGRTIVFSGQWLDRYARKKFPWRRVSIVEAPETGLLFALERDGEPVPPSRVHPHLGTSR